MRINRRTGRIVHGVTQYGPRVDGVKVGPPELRGGEWDWLSDTVIAGPGTIDPNPNAPSTSWHIYRLDLETNELTVLDFRTRSFIQMDEVDQDSLLIGANHFIANGHGVWAANGAAAYHDSTGKTDPATLAVAISASGVIATVPYFSYEPRGGDFDGDILVTDQQYVKVARTPQGLWRTRWVEGLGSCLELNDSGRGIHYSTGDRDFYPDVVSRDGQLIVYTSADAGDITPRRYDLDPAQSLVELVPPPAPEDVLPPVSAVVTQNRPVSVGMFTFNDAPNVGNSEIPIRPTRDRLYRSIDQQLALVLTAETVDLIPLSLRWACWCGEAGEDTPLEQLIDQARPTANAAGLGLLFYQERSGFRDSVLAKASAADVAMLRVYSEKDESASAVLTRVGNESARLKAKGVAIGCDFDALLRGFRTKRAQLDIFIGVTAIMRRDRWIGLWVFGAGRGESLDWFLPYFEALAASCTGPAAARAIGGRPTPEPKPLPVPAPPAPVPVPPPHHEDDDMQTYPLQAALRNRKTGKILTFRFGGGHSFDKPGETDFDEVITDVSKIAADELAWIERNDDKTLTVVTPNKRAIMGVGSDGKLHQVVNDPGHRQQDERAEYSAHLLMFVNGFPPGGGDHVTGIFEALDAKGSVLPLR